MTQITPIDDEGNIDQLTLEVNAAVEFHSLSNEEKTQWIIDRFTPLQTMMDGYFDEPVVHKVTHFKNMEEKNQYDEARELERAVNVHRAKFK